MIAAPTLFNINQWRMPKKTINVLMSPETAAITKPNVTKKFNTPMAEQRMSLSRVLKNDVLSLISFMGLV